METTPDDRESVPETDGTGDDVHQRGAGGEVGQVATANRQQLRRDGRHVLARPTRRRVLTPIARDIMVHLYERRFFPLTVPFEELWYEPPPVSEDSGQ
jgi:hypothetical protein